MSDIPASTPVVIIGAGFSGMCAAIRLKLSGQSDFLVLEQAPSFGGVWHHNSYPGAACDVPSSLYSFSFESDYDWARSHGSHSEICDYMQYCLRKYDIEPNFHFNAEVASIQWFAERQRWILESPRGVVEAKWVISACGLFNQPAIPSLPGLEQFQGLSFHSARWHHGFDHLGKRVAVIGNGCSAAQFVPEIAGGVDRIALFMRTACHVIPKQERIYSDEERALYARFPILRAVERAKQIAGARNAAGLQLSDAARDELTRAVVEGMAVQISDPEKRKALLPDFPVMAKRPIASDTFLTALDRPNVLVVTSSITKVTSNAIEVAGGSHIEIDAIIFATGFQVSEYLAPMDVRGCGGLDLREVWQDGAHAYFGTLVPGFPNFFMVYGPNTNVIGSVLQIIEPQVEFILRCIAASQKSGKLVEVSAEVENTFNGRIQEDLSRTIWGERLVKSYFTNERGRIVTQWPGTAKEFEVGIGSVDSDSCLVDA